MKHLSVKLKVFSYHVILSLIPLGLLMALIRFIWFPGVTFELEDVWQGLKVLIPVYTILGPILLFILFVPGKKGMKFDIAVVIALQLAALIYGGYGIYESRPVVYAFVGDRFEIIPAKSIRLSALENSSINQSDGSPLTVYALPAQSPEEQKAFILENVQYQLMPGRYRELEPYAEIVMSKSISPTHLNPNRESSITALENFYKLHEESRVALFILQGTTREANFIILSRDDLSLQGFLAVDPWTELEIPKN